MMQINDQIILEEDYDENYQPTEDGKWNFRLKTSVTTEHKILAQLVYSVWVFSNNGPWICPEDTWIAVDELFSVHFVAI